MSYIEKTVFGIETDNGEKIVHFYGYGYHSDDGTDTPYRFLEYTFCYVPLKKVLEMGFEEAESQYGPEVKQYIADCTRDEMESIYEHYDNGNKPTELKKEDLNMDTPLGVYILI